MNHWINTARHWAGGHHTAAWAIGVPAALLLIFVLLKLYVTAMHTLNRIGNLRRRVQAPKWKPENILTVLIALTVTVYAGLGNWQFLTKAMHYGVDLKLILVWVFEGSVVVEGLRARRNILDYGVPGIDGRALWVLAGTSSLLSVSESSNVPEAMARLIAPLLAAFLWERLMKAPMDAEALSKAKVRREALEAASGSDVKPKRRISWRIRPERILVWVGLADSTDTTTLAAESNRRIMKFVKAAERSDRAKSGDKTRRMPWTAAAREARAERGLSAHGLLSYADPTEVYEALSRKKLAATLERLGVEAKAGQEQDAQEPTETAPTADELLAAVDKRVARITTEAADLLEEWTARQAPALKGEVLGVLNQRLADFGGEIRYVLAEVRAGVDPEALAPAVSALAAPAVAAMTADAMATVDQRLTKLTDELVSTLDQRLSTLAEVYTRETRAADPVHTWVSLMDEAQQSVVDTNSSTPHIHLTLESASVDSGVVAPVPVAWIAPQLGPVDTDDVHLDEVDDDDMPDYGVVDTDFLEDWDEEDSAGASTRAEEDTQETPRVDKETAKALIFAGWSNKTSIPTLVRQTGRSRSYIYKALGALDEKAKRQPAVVANGTALHEQEAGR